MADNSIQLAFACPYSKEDMTVTRSGYHCSGCQNTLVDFTDYSPDEIRAYLKNRLQTPCGIYKRSQLSHRFLRTAAVSVLVSASFTNAWAQTDSTDHHFAEGKALDTLRTDTIPLPENEDIVFGFVTEDYAVMLNEAPTMNRLIEELRYPEGLTVEGRVYVSVTIDKNGCPIDYQVLKGLDPIADAEALRALKSVDLSFSPAKMHEKPVQSSLLIPIRFRKE